MNRTGPGRFRAATVVSLLGLAACTPASPHGSLPEYLAGVVALERGGYASLLVQLPRPGQPPEVEIAPGVLAAGQGWALGIGVHAAIDGVGDTFTELEITDMSTGERVEASLPPGARLAGISQDSVWFETVGAMVGVDAHTGESLAGPAPEDVGGRLGVPGPGVGFAARLDGGRLELLLPRMDVEQWDPLLQGVDAVMGTWWLDTRQLPDWERELLERQFSHVSVLAGRPGTATVDGDLEEWRGTRSLAVDRERQIIDSADYWSGPRDGSFAVAVRVHRGRVLLAVRVRDDHPLVGQDRIYVRFADRDFEVRLGGTGTDLVGPWWTAGTTSIDATQYGFELGLDVGSVRSDPLALPLVVQLVDHDPGQGSTRLGTGKSASMVGVGVSGAE